MKKLFACIVVVAMLALMISCKANGGEDVTAGNEKSTAVTEETSKDLEDEVRPEESSSAEDVSDSGDGESTEETGSSEQNDSDDNGSSGENDWGLGVIPLG